MLDKIDFERFSDLLQQSHNQWWGWCKGGGYNYLTNRHISLRYKDSEQREPHSEDFWSMDEITQQIFGNAAPEEGKAVINQGFGQSDGTKMIKQLEELHNSIPAQKGVVTRALLAFEWANARQVRFGDFDSYINDDYIRLIRKATEEPALTRGVDSPVHFLNGYLVILPVRSTKIN